ncbi:outer membrane protein [Faunimonas pinastri]|uniref:Outer membrane protein n=1 Tax=Faunimonas pinastri TaxID=1855383 RepID=A0A1H9L7R7_9HYPH|nr:OmpW family protein [Faunimonas pinastri]SER07486.1 outer membrane protein [Faunimonas pinastri]
MGFEIMWFRIAALCSVALSLGVTSKVFAADLPTQQTSFAGDAQPIAFNPWMLRVRALGVLPDGDSSLKLNGTRLGGDKTDITNTVVPELDITYFFTRHIAAELILGATRHKVEGAGSIKSLGDVGDVWLLPPTVTLQYHFDLTPKIKPYVGAGVNYTFFFGEESKGIFSNFDVHNQVGGALQAGVDYMINDHWGLNVDVKKIFLNPRVTADIDGVGHVSGHVKIDPWLVGAGVTYKF